jgi:uncharacterized protein (TIGR01370 family)
MPNIFSYAVQYSNVNFNAIFNSTFDLFITEGDADDSPFLVPALSGAQIAQLIAQGRSVVGYVDVAVTDANRAYWQDSWTDAGPNPRANDDLNPVAASAPSFLRNRPTNGSGILVDFTDPAWQILVINQAAALVQRGYSGVYLDNVGAYDDAVPAEIRDTPAGQAAIRALATQMMDFVAAIKTAMAYWDDSAILIVNGDPYLHTSVTQDAAGAETAAHYLKIVDAHVLENQSAAALDYAQTSLAGETRLILESDGSPAYSYADAWERGILYTARNQSFNSLGAFAYPATAGDDRLTGGDGPNRISGLAGNDVIDGGAGVDRLDGGPGDDVIVVDNAGDVIVEAIGGGYDYVEARHSYTLAAGVEIELLGTSDNESHERIDLTGNEFSQVIIGNAGDNILRGGGGADILAGMDGSDTYYPDADDVIRENHNGGDGDCIRVLATYVLPAGFEIEQIETADPGGTQAINLTGNEFRQGIVGNAGANVLDGGAGNDFGIGDALVGGGGDDTYFVNYYDGVGEAVGGGYDYVVARTSYQLSSGAEVELLGTTDNAGTAAIDLTGNEFSQIIIGNAGANTIDGGRDFGPETGADILAGFGGDDNYFVDANDIVREAAGGGYDYVMARSSYALGAGIAVELLGTIGNRSTSDFNLTGNEFGQIIIGNGGANVLDGGLGADRLVGDVEPLFGGGRDSFAFTTALGNGNIDEITDFRPDFDRILLANAIFAAIGTGPLGAGAFATGSAAADADDRIVYNSATGALFYDADGSGGGAAVQFATLQPDLGVTASDFQVI